MTAVLVITILLFLGISCYLGIRLAAAEKTAKAQAMVLDSSHRAIQVLAKSVDMNAKLYETLEQIRGTTDLGELNSLYNKILLRGPT